MRVSSAEDFELVYSLLKHEYLGFIFDAHAVQKDGQGKLTLRYQTVSPQNIHEFRKGADGHDEQIVALIDELRQENIVKKFSQKKASVAEFFLKNFSADKKGLIRDSVSEYVEGLKTKLMPLLREKPFYIMGQDGNPAWQKVEFSDTNPTVRFHFHRNEGDTHYYPTLKFKGQKLDFVHRGARIICNQPAYLLLHGTAYQIEGRVDGKKLQPFLEKKFLAIPRKIEDDYFRRFVAPLIATEDVQAFGFKVEKVLEEARFELRLEELPRTAEIVFASASKEKEAPKKGPKPKAGKEEAGKEKPGKDKELPLPPAEGTLSVYVHYLAHYFPLSVTSDNSVITERDGESYRFIRIFRDMQAEDRFKTACQNRGLALNGYHIQAPIPELLDWIQEHGTWLEEQRAEVLQMLPNGRFDLSPPRLELKAHTAIDWFELSGTVRFGEYEVPFARLRNAILRKEQTIKAPDGTLLHIPGAWMAELRHLFEFSKNDGDTIQLPKMHGSLLDPFVGEEKVRGGEIIAEVPDDLIKPIEIVPSAPPKTFHGKLRPYQQHGYEWLLAMRRAKLGACLADDMGLGKTIQTLAMLASVNAEVGKATHLLVVPNSLLYNWEREAKRFAPSLKILRHIGTNRARGTAHFGYYQIVMTSYGTLRSDEEMFQGFEFHYVILDEAHAIKNHTSSTARAAMGIKAKHRLSLTGTPVENNLMELWSQMNFLNPGLLGSIAYFRNEYAIPIEKNANHERMARLQKRIKPFLLRRLKSEVAADLPDRSEQVVFCEMSQDQQEVYERIKTQYRLEVFRHLEEGSLQRNRMMVLRGLVHLRQLACHPRMTEMGYPGSSGKFENICYKLEEALEEGHRILIFSQFVKHLNILRDWLDKRKVKYAVLTGQTKDRKGQVDLFEQNPGIQLFLLSLKAGGVGLNLTSADYVFLLDPWWNPAAEAQAIDRAHRIGQTKNVFVYRFISKDTVEEKILDLQDRKRAMVGSLLYGESLLTQLTEKEIGEMFN